MATKVHMEALSPTMEEGEVVNWLKSEGDEVTNGDVLAEIETDKATMELVARGEGVLRTILLGEGGTAPVGDVIAVIAGADEDIDDLLDEVGGDGAGAAAAAGAPDEGEAEEEAGEEAETEDEATEKEETDEAEKEEAAAAPAAESGGRIKASPLARRLAEEGDLELAEVKGSGPGGRIVKRDVEAAMEEREREPAAAEAPAGAELPPPLEELPEEAYEDVSVSQMRKTIARRLTESLGPVPHFFLTTEVDMGRALEARARINDVLEDDGEKISINDLIIRATASALKKHPECNAAWQEDSIRVFNRVHVGVAVAVPDGLITPVIRDADRKGVARIGREVKEMAGRAREKKLQPEEYTGSTFSISNLGMFGIQEFTAVINPPEAGILAVGAVEEVPVVDDDGEVVVRPRMKMTMSCDHRVIDGATGARFLQTLKTMLEEPGTIVM